MPPSQDTAEPKAVAGADAPLVMVVDDNPDTRVICETSLRAAGYRTISVGSGAEAIARLDHLTPALVVLDLAMPGVDGFATARAIRARAATRDVPILVFTGLPLEAEENARKAGGTAFCTKPIEPRRFLAEVTRLCPANGGTR
jgi:CheY-like chemotaxis protein